MQFCGFAGREKPRGHFGHNKAEVPGKAQTGRPRFGEKAKDDPHTKKRRCRTGYVRERREKKNQPVISLTLTLRFSRKERVQASAVAMAARAASPVIRGRNSQGTGSP